MRRARPAAAVIVLGFGGEEYLEDCLTSLLAELEADDVLVLVDNGIAEAASRRSGWDPRIQVMTPQENLGFAGGTAYAAQATSQEVLVFVNSDAIVRPGSLEVIIRAAAEVPAALVGGCLRLADRPDLINSAGNPLHFTGITWAGHCGEPADDHQRRQEVAVATGGFCALGRDLWDSVGGFDPIYFAYHEDTDLSIRTRLAGHEVLYEPDAIADHHYEFGRSPIKMYLVERNRLMTVLTDYPSPLLCATAPVLMALEAALLLLAFRQGWARQKVDAWVWVVAHRSALHERRRRVQRQVTVDAPSEVLAAQMVSRIEPPMVEHPPGVASVNVALTAYWRLVQPLLRLRPSPAGARKVESHSSDVPGRWADSRAMRLARRVYPSSMSRNLR